MTREQKYIDKIKNDIDERLWDLLIIHLFNAPNRIEPKSKFADTLIEVLELAIKKLQFEVKEFNKRFYYRYILITCNTLLRYDKYRKDIKDLKVSLLNDFIDAEGNMEDKIPLNYQINEVRITYDTRYLEYLVKDLIKQKEWNKALYCLFAVRLLEPDNEYLDEWYNEITTHFSGKNVPYHNFGKPYNETLALDSNIVIAGLSKNVGDFRLNNEYIDLNSLAENNKLIITTSVTNEVKEHLNFMMLNIKRVCEKQHRNFNEIQAELLKRFNDLMDKYEVKTADNDLSDIKKFYLQFPKKLEHILTRKIGWGVVSKKLKKMAQRTSMLPEEGDMRLLSEVISMDNVSIITNDIDFYGFTSQIYDEFKIKVFKY